MTWVRQTIKIEVYFFVFFQKQEQEALNKFFYAGTAFVIVCPEQPEGSSGVGETRESCTVGREEFYFSWRELLSGREKEARENELERER